MDTSYINALFNLIFNFNFSQHGMMPGAPVAGMQAPLQPVSVARDSVPQAAPGNSKHHLGWGIHVNDSSTWFQLY